MTELEAVQHVIACNAQANPTDRTLIEPYYADIEAYGKVILLIIKAGDGDAVIGGFQGLFLHAYLCGRRDTNRRQQ
jgi:hypothetical protein